MNQTLHEIGRLARHARCEIDLRSDGRIVLRRGKKRLTSSGLSPLAALAWLHRETQRFEEQRAKAKLAREAR